jgi:hypothetical protein
LSATILLADFASLERLEAEGGLHRAFVGRYWGTLDETADPSPRNDGEGFDDLLESRRLVSVDESLLGPIDPARPDRIGLERLRKNFLRKIAGRRHVWLCVIDGDDAGQEQQLAGFEERVRASSEALGDGKSRGFAVLVFTRPMSAAVRDSVGSLTERLPGVLRLYVMGDRLQPSLKEGRLVQSFAVWPVCVARLLVVLASREGTWLLDEPDRSGRRVFAWRTRLWGTGDFEELMPRYRQLLRERLLPSKDPESEELAGERDRAFPVGPEDLVDRAPPETARLVEEFRWQEDPDDLERRAMSTIRTEVFEELLGVSGSRSIRARGLQVGIKRDGEERKEIREWWSKVRESGFVALRRLRDGRFGIRRDILERHETQRAAWASLIEERRVLDVAREHHRDAAEEVVVARRRHLGLGWRLAMAAAVMIFVGQFIASILLPLRPPGSPVLPPIGNSFMGIPLEGGSVGYLVDRSGSMAGERIAKLRDELERSVDGLGGGTPFCVIAYSTDHQVMKGGEGGLVPKQGDLGKEAVEWIRSLEAEGGTRPVDGLRRILSMKPDTLVFLTDGEFSEEDKEAVRQLIKDFDAKRPTTRIHTVALYQRAEEPFLKAIAERTGGEYRFVAWDPFAPLGFETVATIILMATLAGAAIGAFLPWWLEVIRGQRGTRLLRASMAGLLHRFAIVTWRTQELVKGSVEVRMAERENDALDLNQGLAARAFRMFERLMLGERQAAGGALAAPPQARLAREDLADLVRGLDVPLPPGPDAVDGMAELSRQALVSLAEKDAKTILETWRRLSETHDPGQTGHLPAWAIERELGDRMDRCADEAVMKVIVAVGEPAMVVPAPGKEPWQDLIRKKIEEGPAEAENPVPFMSVCLMPPSKWQSPKSLGMYQLPNDAPRVEQSIENIRTAFPTWKKTDAPGLGLSVLGVSALGWVHEEFAIRPNSSSDRWDIVPRVTGEDGAA